ncbi:hypothetical protein PQE74_gp213 [Bacillus phage vB_BanS_Chewbecca]|uniref:Uncharacterized protein n=1 Tax=Bacillus phage vB_BanS_Chewbecca TaxID=2894786 RepID=A0AAE8YPC1_9CAUD|nr:hypothetical protein PQE74_gp213 [Bacillus phage vB_BanS_Chewbecca]UGO46317.1 hypothetical protein CHEWBECCA_254 [Bacillus phage vB_BanS_Chewbecca]
MEGLSDMARKQMRLDKMCAKCFKQVKDGEEHGAIPVVDDVGNQRMFTGHVICMEYLAKELSDIYNGDE